MANKKKKKKVPFESSGAKAAAFTANTFFQKHGIAIFLSLIALLGFLAYANTFRVPFEFDDLYGISHNAAITSFHGLIDGQYISRIAGYFTFAVNYRINGLNVVGYHIFNLAVHLTSALLVFGLVLLTFKTPFFQVSWPGESGARFTAMLIALFSALLFVAHPVQTQAVTYTVQRFASLATLFYLLSLLLYVKWRLVSTSSETAGAGRMIPAGSKAGRGFLYAGSLVAALLAMATKEIAFTLPAMILLFEFAFFRGDVKKRIAGLLPFGLTLPLIPLSLMVSSVPMLSARGDTPILSAGDYLLTQSRVIITYIRLLFFPVGQNLDYDYPTYHSLFNPNVILSLLLILGIIGGAVFLFRYSKKFAGAAPLRLVAFGVFWFFITLSVESSVIPIADVIFEHRLYLPSVGFFIAIVTGVFTAALALKKRIPWINKAMIPALALVVLVLAGATYARNNVWRDEVTLWSDVVQKSPGKDRPHFDLGTIYQDRGESDKAGKEFELALNINPDDADAHLGLGDSYLVRNNPARAQLEFKSAIGLNPDNERAYNHLGISYLMQGQISAAIDEIKHALDINPDYAEAHYSLGTAYAGLGDLEQSRAEFERALQLKPDYQAAKDYLQRLRNTSTVRP